VSIIAPIPAGVQQSACHAPAEPPAGAGLLASLADCDGPTDEDYDAMFDAWSEGEGRAFPDDYAGLTDADGCPGGID
jgi:hypothetical protein